jgi:exodeoxyribonuclease VII large subunit
MPTVPQGIQVLTVSQVTQAVRQLLEAGFPSVWVMGEISGLKRHNSGHQYFNLKDANAVLKAVLFRGIGFRLRFDLKDGMEVIARGGLSVYAPQGNYQLIVEEIQPKGIGALELALRQLKEKLLARGYFDPKRKRPLPNFPRRVALVTSPSGAAVRDMLEILGQRWPAAEVWVCPVRVQGDGAAQEIAEALALLNRVRPGPDVLILGRGGGSAEDLGAFNEEIVADAIFASRIPVVSGVGHEIDITIADLVADCRAETPTAAAIRAVPSRLEQMELLSKREDRLHELLHSRLQAARQRLDELAQRRAFRLPLERVRDLERRLDDWDERLTRAVRQRVQQTQERAAALAARLETLSPLNVLGRGYSLTRNEAGQLIRDAAQVQPGDRLVTLLHQGRLVSRVEETAHE